MTTEVEDLGDLSPKSCGVKLGGRTYQLREMSEASAVLYANERAKRTKRDAEGKAVGFEDLAELEPLLVSLCLFDVTEGKDVPVPLTTVKGFLHRHITKMSDKARDLNPDLFFAAETVEDLDREIARLQARKKELESGDPKAGMPTTGATSA